MVFSTLLILLLFFVHFFMLIRQKIPLIASPPVVIAFFLVFLWLLGEARNKLMWHVQYWSRISCPYWYHISAPLVSIASQRLIVTTRVSFILLTMRSSMNGQNTSRSIIILSVFILSMVLSNWSQSLLKINLQISSSSHILKDTFVLWLTTSSWFHIHLEFEGDC